MSLTSKLFRIKSSFNSKSDCISTVCHYIVWLVLKNALEYDYTNTDWIIFGKVRLFGDKKFSIISLNNSLIFECLFHFFNP
ncbi:hypothetical protein BpHYR1_050524 [Brachionus plicatilis]|uniref:Uncharacterized protein n=1 Tax=Brachionus plicatilis TaxID=10195 RepID=A0A3M7Q1J3_BRAPC|nr:hypothetical protein BpHYR1_050524 [Brachionus plicatilis]